MIKWALLGLSLIGFCLNSSSEMILICLVGSLVCQHIDNRLK